MCTTYENNTVLGPINSWMFKVLSGYMNYLFGKSKRKLFKSHPKTVVEIGPGAGANMRYLKKGTKLIAIEPNIHMHTNLKKSAKKYGINLEIKAIVGEAVDLPDNSIDFVVCTLVMCTVKNPSQCVEQIKRILKPSGVFIFIEHVKAKENTFVSFIQNLTFKPWFWFFEGCNTKRDTKSLLESAGFSSLVLEEYNSYSPFIPITPQIRGRAIK
ncbi:class I SAM-dependent methyltransferase [Flagellimonas sp. CMM7]|uniref:class I SAM-dependent methyltransferase n=1 Tax=Flagellimonas sp. CMM7 TaxID=2654676 RepID=UPI0013CFE1D5|nr:class I SAM-dependent methyltransferase [Flagellimonas sp. CMM7]UII79498.1 class I SAM-dependent methyltransferase [Flagellimonas sp. CMM7]